MAARLLWPVAREKAGPPDSRFGCAATGEASDPSGSTLFSSVQAVGLKLEPRKLPYEFLVIDKIEKTPSEN